jgi:hypothetical protein
MKGYGRTLGTIGMLGVAVAALLLVPGLVAPASASPAPLTGGTSQQWAYGAQKWVNVTVDYPNATYSAHAFFGWNVVFTATNTSTTTVELEAQRTMVGDYYATLCSPTCAAPTAQGNLSITAWEKDTGFANLTTTASVYESGTAVPAVGLMNDSARVAGNISESVWLKVQHGATTLTASTELFIAGSAESAVSFSPALGLVPLNTTTGSTWNSSSNISAAGSWSATANWYHTSVLGSTSSGSFTPSGSVSGTGTVALQGADLGNVTLANGASSRVIALAWSGPFDCDDGIILIPHAFDLFGSATHVWGSDELGATIVATSDLDIAIDSFHHIHLNAATTSFGSTDTSLSTATAATTVGPSPASVSTPSTVLQAQPESVAAAQSSNACDLGQCGPVTTAAAGAPIGLVLVIGLVAALVVGSVSVIEYRVWARKRAERGQVGTSSPIRPVNPSYSVSAAYMTPPNTSQQLPPPPQQEPPRSQ